MATAPHTSELEVGERVGERYEVVDVVASGGMGTVYRATQSPFDRLVALKIMHARHVANDELRSRFFREAEAMSQLTHPNTVTVFDYGQADSICYIAMEYVEGETVGQLLRERGGLEPEEAVPIAVQVAQSLGEAHAKGIIHRDLKPDNILVSIPESGELFAKVADFGIAKILDRDTQFTQVGNIVGTPFYMSPEQSKSGEVDARSDLYALGCCLYEMLTGRPPFMGTTPIEVLLKHRTEDPPSLGPNFPSNLDSFLRDVLAKSPDRRPRDAQAFVRELMACYVQPDWEETPQAALAETMEPGLSESTEKGTPPQLVARSDRDLEVSPSATNSSISAMVALHEIEGADSKTSVSTSRMNERASKEAPRVPAWAGLIVVALIAASVGMALLSGPGEVLVRFESDPTGAVISLDGVSIGRTPADEKLIAEELAEVTFSLDAHEPRSIEFDPARRDKIFAELRRAQVELVVTSPLERASLYVNGEGYGVLAPQKPRTFLVDYPDGALRLELRSPDHEKYVVNIPHDSIGEQTRLAPDLDDFVKSKK